MISMFFSQSLILSFVSLLFFNLYVVKHEIQLLTVLYVRYLLEWVIGTYFKPLNILHMDGSPFNRVNYIFNLRLFCVCVCDVYRTLIV